MSEYFLTDYRFRVCDNYRLRGLNKIVIVLCNLMSKNQEPIMALGKNLRPFTSQYISLDRSSGESVEYPNIGLSGNMKTIRFGEILSTGTERAY